MKNILFICNQNLNRSKTAEEIFSEEYNTKSAGLFNEYPLDEKTLEWADVVVVMEDHQRKEISKRFPELYLKKRIISLDISDIYHYRQPELIELLKTRVNEKVKILI